MSRLLPALLFLAACSFDGGGIPAAGDDDTIADDAGGGAIDAGVDALVTADFDPSNLDGFEILDAPADPLTLTPGVWTLDTDTVTLRDPAGEVVPEQPFTVFDGQPAMLAWALRRLTIDADAILRVRGARSLIIVAERTITVAGTIDVSAGCEVEGMVEDRDLVWCGGPGGGNGAHPVGDSERSGATGCAPGGNGEAGTTRSERGGGGGGYGTAGGDGGGADGNGTDSEGGGVCGAETLEPLRGGSGGGAAGYRNGSTDDNRTSGGGGGGALQLTSRQGIEITGVLDASGEGGAGTAQAGTSAAGGDGGGGGGAGGAILLEGPSVNVAAGAIVVANGGGGGAGVTADRRGEKARREAVRAAGGLNDDNVTGGGFGAIGAGDDEGATAGSDPGDGGSGGGGGAGRIRLRGTVISASGAAVISPAATEATLGPP